MSDFERPYEVEGGPPPIDAARIPAPPRLTPAGVEIPPIAPDSAVCLQCAYALRGLDTGRNCPECGSPIRRSLMGNLLEFSSREYVTTLHRGVVLILVATIAQFVLGLLAVVALLGLVLLNMTPNSTINFSQESVEVWVSALTLPTTALLLLGWWFFSAPDPAILGREKGQKPRLIIRITVAIMAALSAADLAVKTAAPPGMSGDLAEAVAALVVGAAGVAQFFASVLYVRWLAPRIPDVALFEKARKYLWQLPLIYVLGAICFGIGPLIATIMYLLMLNTVRNRLSGILARPVA